MSFLSNDPEARRSVRSYVQSLCSLLSLLLLAWIVHLLSSNPSDLDRIALGLVLILGVREVLHGAENVSRSINFEVGAGGIKGEFK